MITDKDQLKLKLLKYNEHERLDRHADVEIAYANEKDQVKKLEALLKKKDQECAELRYDLNKHNSVEEQSKLFMELTGNNRDTIAVVEEDGWLTFGGDMAHMGDMRMSKYIELLEAEIKSLRHDMQKYEKIFENKQELAKDSQ